MKNIIIQSKRNEDKIIEVSLEQWNKMKDNQTSRNWRILSSHNLGPDIEPAKPADVINFMNAEPKVEKIYKEQGETDYSLLLKSELVAECEKEGIELTGKELKNELIELLTNKL